MIEEIKKFQEKSHNVTNINEEDEHLLFMCHYNTEKIVHDAIKEHGLEIDSKYIHIFASDYYRPGEVYHVIDKKIKRLMLIARKVIDPSKDNTISLTTNYNINGYSNISYYTYTTISKPGNMNIW